MSLSTASSLGESVTSPPGIRQTRNSLQGDVPMKPNPEDPLRDVRRQAKRKHGAEEAQHWDPSSDDYPDGLSQSPSKAARTISDTEDFQHMIGDTVMTDASGDGDLEENDESGGDKDAMRPGIIAKDLSSFPPPSSATFSKEDLAANGATQGSQASLATDNDAYLPPPSISVNSDVDGAVLSSGDIAGTIDNFPIPVGLGDLGNSNPSKMLSAVLGSEPHPLLFPNDFQLFTDPCPNPTCMTLEAIAGQLQEILTNQASAAQEASKSAAKLKELSRKVEELSAQIDTHLGDQNNGKNKDSDSPVLQSTGYDQPSAETNSEDAAFNLSVFLYDTPTTVP